MRDIRFDKQQNALFRSIRLRPHYFVDADCSKFNFHDCDWKGGNLCDLNVIDKIGSGRKHKTLAQICNQLAINYEENRNFEQSSVFRYKAMEAKRSEYTGIRKYLNLYLAYKMTSGYGEKWTLALAWLLGLIIFFSALYAVPQISLFDYGKSPLLSDKDRIEKEILNLAELHEVPFPDSLAYSLSVATFQRPEPKPYSLGAKLLIVFEVISIPMITALLALAIRRKFMR